MFLPQPSSRWQLVAGVWLMLQFSSHLSPPKRVFLPPHPQLFIPNQDVHSCRCHMFMGLCLCWGLCTTGSRADQGTHWSCCPWEGTDACLRGVPDPEHCLIPHPAHAYQTANSGLSLGGTALHLLAPKRPGRVPPPPSPGVSEADSPWT